MCQMCLNPDLFKVHNTVRDSIKSLSNLFPEDQDVSAQKIAALLDSQRVKVILPEIPNYYAELHSILGTVSVEKLCLSFRFQNEDIRKQLVAKFYQSLKTIEFDGRSEFDQLCLLAAFNLGNPELAFNERFVSIAKELRRYLDEIDLDSCSLADPLIFSASVFYDTPNPNHQFESRQSVPNGFISHDSRCGEWLNVHVVHRGDLPLNHPANKIRRALIYCVKQSNPEEGLGMGIYSKPSRGRRRLSSTEEQNSGRSGFRDKNPIRVIFPES